MSIRLALAFFVACLAAFTTHAQRDHNEVTLVPDSDRDMREAIAKAQATLDDFLRTWKSSPAGTSEFKLKVRITDGDKVEHFWVTPFREDGTRFAGTLANEPRLVRNLRAGQIVRFSRTEISDWGYVRDGKQVGSFTVCAMFKSAPREQVEYYRKNYGFAC